LRLFVRKHTDQQTCQEVIASVVGGGSQVLVLSDEWRGYARLAATCGITHRTVCHSRGVNGYREWARDDDGDGRREVHCNSCEGSGAALRTYLRRFRGVRKDRLGEYCACYEAMYNAKSISPELIQSMCFRLHGDNPYAR
jgi:hypothetical protein